jgi:hypothetical protein
LVLTSVLQPFLAAATQYWLVAAIPTGVNFQWYGNNTGVLGGAWASATSLTSLSNFGSTGPASGIQVNSVTGSVPDGGSTAALFGLGLSALLLLKSSAPRGLRS